MWRMNGPPEPVDESALSTAGSAVEALAAVKQGVEEEKKHIEHNVPHRFNPYFHLPFWTAYKSGNTGFVTGLFVGGGVGVLTGIGVALALTAFGTALTAAAAGALVVGCAIAGMAVGAHKFGDAGNAAGAAAGVATIQEKRLLKGIALMLSRALGRKVDAPASEELDDDVPIPTHLSDSPHFLSTSSFDMKPFYPKVGIPGLLIGAGVGAAAAFAAPFALPLLESVGVAHFIVTGVGHLSYAGAMTAFGLFGASFGVNRNYFRKVADWVDKGLAEGWFSKDSEGITPYIQRSRAIERLVAEEAAAAQAAAHPSQPRQLLGAASEEQDTQSNYWREAMRKRALHEFSTATPSHDGRVH